MAYSDAPSDVPVCGICGRPLDDQHDSGGHGGANVVGKRVEYIVVGKRGGIAEFREADVESRVRKTDATTLALQLGIEEIALLGRRFTCWVEPAEYGVIRSDFRLITE